MIESDREERRVNKKGEKQGTGRNEVVKKQKIKERGRR